MLTGLLDDLKGVSPCLELCIVLLLQHAADGEGAFEQKELS
jgi:hypothetical protein